MNRLTETDPIKRGRPGTVQTRLNADDGAIAGSKATGLEAQSTSVVDSAPGKIGPTPVFLIRALVPSHQPPVTAAARTGLVCAHARAGTHRAFGPVLGVWAPRNSPAAGHPGSVGNCAHDGSFDRAGVGPAASRAPCVRTGPLNTILFYHIVRLKGQRP